MVLPSRSSQSNRKIHIHTNKNLINVETHLNRVLLEWKESSLKSLTEKLNGKGGIQKLVEYQHLERRRKRVMQTVIRMGSKLNNLFQHFQHRVIAGPSFSYYRLPQTILSCTSWAVHADFLRTKVEFVTWSVRGHTSAFRWTFQHTGLTAFLSLWVLSPSHPAPFPCPRCPHSHKLWASELHYFLYQECSSLRVSQKSHFTFGSKFKWELSPFWNL